MQFYEALEQSESLEETVLYNVSAPTSGMPLIMWLLARPLTTSALSSATITVRWNDGTEVKSCVVVLSLAEMSSPDPITWPILLEDYQDLTLEIVLTGTGTFKLKIACCTGYSGI